MRKTLTVSMAVLAMAFGIPSHAQAPMHQMEHSQTLQHVTSSAGDVRQQVDFPPEMRQHTLSNMRDHLEALSEILTGMSAGNYAKAAQVARTRLGMDSPSAAGCKAAAPSDTPPMSKPAGMDHQMSQFMPEGMRDMGLAMHQAASDFAVESSKAGKSGNPRQALVALSKVTQQCTACHASYKLQ